jgi:uncharacterized membrane protein YdbT with pleckstrin-like domain
MELCMSSYIQDSLISGEELLYTGHVSLWPHWHWIVFGILGLPLFGLGLVLLAVAYVRYRSTELAITNLRVIAKFGFISRHTVEVNLDKVESVEVDQGVAGRLFDYGTIYISGTGTHQAPIAKISRPMEFRNAFTQAERHAHSAAAV